MPEIEWEELLGDVAVILQAPDSAQVALQNVCDLLHARVTHYDWVGFYMVDAGMSELVLGPFAGEPTEHTRIGFGQGVCGQAASMGRTLVVDDVGREENYLACSLQVKSEIVVPMKTGGCLVGELDIDSHKPAAFTEADRVFCETVAELAAGIIAGSGPNPAGNIHTA